MDRRPSRALEGLGSMLFSTEFLMQMKLSSFQSSGGPKSLVFSIEVLIEPNCQASRALEAEINTKCAVELPELWGPEIDAVLIEFLIEIDRRASRALEVRNRYFSEYNS